MSHARCSNLCDIKSWPKGQQCHNYDNCDCTKTGSELFIIDIYEWTKGSWRAARQIGPLHLLENVRENFSKFEMTASCAKCPSHWNRNQYQHYDVQRKYFWYWIYFSIRESRFFDFFIQIETDTLIHLIISKFKAYNLCNPFKHDLRYAFLWGVEFVFTKERREKEGAAGIMF